MFTLKPGETDKMRRQNSEDSDGCEQSSDEEGDTGSNSGDGDSNKNGDTNDGYGGDNDCGAGIIYAIHYTIIILIHTSQVYNFIMNYVSFSGEQGQLVSCLTSAALISPAETSTTSYDAHSCKIHRFKGTEVDWVQCDGCDRWMHLFCIGKMILKVWKSSTACEVY